MSSATDSDVLIIGGGPAGLATAIAARGHGLEVRVLDRRRPPIDKACGEGLMPDGVAALRGLGVDLSKVGFPFRGIRYLDGDLVAEGSFPGGNGLGIRRLELHRALLRRAEQIGVDLCWETAVEDLGCRPDGRWDEARTTRGVYGCRWLVGADGLRSRVRRWVGLEGRGEPVEHGRFGVRRHFRVRPWSPKVEVYWAEECEAYVTPVAEDEVGVAILWSGRKARFDALLSAFPRLRDRLAEAPAVSRDRGSGPLRQRALAPTRRNVALVGDASGYVDAITGEGLSLAFHQASALADALARADLRPYRRQCRRIARLPDATTELLLRLERFPSLRRRLISILARDPDTFSRLLAVHSRQEPFLGTVIPLLPRLLRGLRPGREPIPDPARREG